MFQSLEVFQLAHNMAVHSGRRQALISQNIANADTPGYVARDLLSFQETLRPGSPGLQKSTRDNHLHGVPSNAQAPVLEDKTFASISGNSVSIEREMLKAVETKRHHDRALAIYKSSMTVFQKILQR